MSVTAPIEPWLASSAAKVTTPPLLVRLLPAASFNCTVSVLIAMSLASRLVGAAVTVLVVAEAAPAVIVKG